MRHLSTSPKDRTSSEHADHAATAVGNGDITLTVPDDALCVHTRLGRLLGRGILHWWEHGALVRDEHPGPDHTYRDALLRAKARSALPELKVRGWSLRCHRPGQR